MRLGVQWRIGIRRIYIGWRFMGDEKQLHIVHVDHLNGDRLVVEIFGR